MLSTASAERPPCRRCGNTSQWCYAVRSNLVFGTHTLDSLSGVQQGDPLGPLLFSLAIHPIAKELLAQGRNGVLGNPLDLVIFYLDDGVLCGSPQAVSDALKARTQRAAEVGLALNLTKMCTCRHGECRARRPRPTFPRKVAQGHGPRLADLWAVSDPPWRQF